MQGASPAYNFFKDIILYAKGQKRDIEDLEERMSKLINYLTSINSEKERIERLLTHSPSMVQSQAYTLVQSKIVVINKRCIKFINKYAKITNNQLSSTTDLDASTASLMIDELGDLKSKIVTLNALKLAKLSRDVEKLSARASEAVDRLKLEKMIVTKSESNQEKLDDDNVLPVFDTYVDEVLHYLFEEGGGKNRNLRVSRSRKNNCFEKTVRSTARAKFIRQYELHHPRGMSAGNGDSDPC